MQSRYKVLHYKASFLLGILFTTFLTGCKKLVQVDPPDTSITSGNVYTSDATAAAVLTGIYTQMTSANIAGGSDITGMSFFPELSGDNLTLLNGLGNETFGAYYTNALTNITGSDFWTAIYPTIYVVNSAIQGLTNNSALTPAVQQQLLGEAEFIRAFNYFYLVSLYGNVPLATGTDYTVNEGLSRSPAATIWQQIIQDLKNAKALLSTNYLDATLVNTTTSRLRPTTWAARALLARSYLYTQKWDSAEAEADTVIANSALFNLATLNNAFLANSTEAIWQLQPVNVGQNTEDALTYIIPATGPGGQWPVYLSTNLLNSFEGGDQRRVDWVDSVISNGTTYYYPFKYKVDSIGAPVTEYEMVLRIGEQFLIRAEARAWQNEIAGSQSDLNAIRTRAGLSNTSASSQMDLIAAIQHERQVELFTEWGHRWLDLKRTGAIDSVMGMPGNACLAKGGIWSSNWQWYPVPLYELQHDPNLVQNEGY